NISLRRVGTATGQRQGEGSYQHSERTFHDDSPVVSITTLVALTVAIAGEPTSRPRSWTASVEINEATRNGPHCSSTCDMTVSETILVTKPLSLLRAEEVSSPGTL